MVGDDNPLIAPSNIMYIDELLAGKRVHDVPVQCALIPVLEHLHSLVCVRMRQSPLSNHHVAGLLQGVEFKRAQLIRRESLLDCHLRHGQTGTGCAPLVVGCYCILRGYCL